MTAFHPLASFLPRVPKSLIWALLATVLMSLVMLALNQPLLSAQAPQGMFSFQLAATGDHSLAILSSWGQSGIAWATAAIWLDFVFIPIYLGTLLILTGFMLSDRPGVRERKVGRWVKSLFLAAGLSDVGENVLLLNNLTNPTDNISLAATGLALIKFSGLVLGAAGLVIIRAARRRPLRPGPYRR